MTTINQPAIKFNNNISDSNPGETWQETFEFYYGKPRRGNIVKVGNNVSVGSIGQVKVGGSDKKVNCFRLASTTFEITSTYKWAGKDWKQI